MKEVAYRIHAKVTMVYASAFNVLATSHKDAIRQAKHLVEHETDMGGNGRLHSCTTMIKARRVR